LIHPQTGHETIQATERMFEIVTGLHISQVDTKNKIAYGHEMM